MSTPTVDPGNDLAGLTATPVRLEQPVSPRRRVITGALIVVIGLICILGWGLGAKSGDAAFELSDPGVDRFSIPVVRLPADAAAYLLGALICLIGLWQVARGFGRRQMKWVVAAVCVLFVLAFLCWAATGSVGDPIDLVGLIQGSVFLSIPIAMGAMSGVLCERTGVINIAIEGQMLVGAFGGALGASVANNLGVGVVVGVLFGGILGVLLAVFAITFLVNQVVLGVVLNLLALGLTGYGYDALMQTNSQTYNKGLTLSSHKIPLLADIPIVGRTLFDANYIVYAAYIIIIVINVALFRTRWGLRTRAVGEHPQAADTVGIKVLWTRYRNVILGGMMAGLAGAYLTIGAAGQFTKSPVGMTSGQGYIALAALIFGRWNPRGAVAAALLFGFTQELQTLLSAISTPVTIPSDIMLMLPYVVTILAVAGLVGRVQAPAADGAPYVKG